MSGRMIIRSTYRLIADFKLRNLSTSPIYHYGKKSTPDDDTVNKIKNVDDNIHDAAKAVAKTLPGDVKQTESDLLKQLFRQSRVKDSQTRADETKSDSSYKLDAEEKVQGVTQLSTVKQRNRNTNISPENLLSKMKVAKETKTDAIRNNSDDITSGISIRPKYPLFGGPGLGIFSMRITPAAPRSYDRSKTLRHELEQENMKTLRKRPPRNAFEEMIEGTKEGKLWKFPINNDDGIKDEENIGFYQHVFLEDQIADFPAKGPIRHFMDLVIVGLSKNPYLTVKQKHEHIDWFRQYFKEKQALLKENLGEASKFVDI